MGKGKKKGGGKATASTSIEGAIGVLSIADSGASTSQAPEEELDGLTGGGRKNKPAEKKDEAKAVEEKKETPSEPPPTASNPAPKETPEEECVGLGLTGGAKKTRVRKKKPSLAAQEKAKDAGQSAGPSEAVGPPHAVGPPQAARPPQGQASQWAGPGGPYQGGPLPTGRPGAAAAGWAAPAPTQVPTGPYQGGPPPTGWAAPAPTQVPTGPYQGGPPPTGWAAPAPTQVPTGPYQGGPPPTGWAAPAPTQVPTGPYQGGPPPTGWAAPAPTQVPTGPYQGGPPPTGWAAPAPTQVPTGPYQGGPPPTGWAAPAPTQVPTGPYQGGPPPTGWAAPAPTQVPTGPADQGGPSAGPPQGGPRPQAHPQASGDRKIEPLPLSRKQRACKYVIPAKIIGRSVPCTTIQVTTNYLPMVIKPLKVHRYDVSFAPDKPRKMIPAVYKIAKDRLFPNELFAFDMFKNGYCLNMLNKSVTDDPYQKENRRQHKIDIPDPNGKIMSFNISFKYTGFVDFAKIIRHMESQGSSLAVPMEEIQCMDVILRQGTLEAYVKAGRNFFRRPNNPIDLSGGLEMWTGLFQSAIFTSRPFINIDVAHKGFPIQQSILNAWKSFNLSLDRPIEQQMGRGSEGFKDFVKNLKVTCNLVGGATGGQTREFMVNGVKEKPTHLSFTKEDGRSQTVYDYFLKEKKYKIKYPALPCLWVGVRNKGIYYPLELCDVVYGQPIRKQLNDFQLATMVREAATPPDQRKRKIEEVAQSMDYSKNAFFKKFGLEISNKFLEVEAKVLQPPTLNCGEPKGTFPRRGQWMSQKLLQPEPLVSWGFIAIELQPHACNYDMIKSLIAQNGTQMGMKVNEPKLVMFNVLITELRAKLFKALEDEIRFMFIIVPGRGKDYYHKVKQFAECDVGILTQCIKEQVATRRMNPQTIRNILLKVNSKLMGINQALDIRSIPRCIAAGGVMIVGADVTHPSPEQQNIPSIAAVTASIDPKCFIYNIEMSIQSPKEEVIKQFEDMMYDHIKVFVQRNNNKPPKKIYVFRDGVSEGQFAQVMNEELTGLLNAYAKFSREKPEVLFLLVQKRHHTRLFGTDRTKKIVNVEPGTVVDTHIVHPKELDFYMVSHAAIKGTARPTRYHSVCNDGGIPHDEVEQLTFYLCHLYARCMRSVSYPTPTYYAHLACLRARSLTHGVTFDNSVLYGQPRRLRVLDKMLRSSRMFFV